jgi:protein phosphatase
VGRILVFGATDKGQVRRNNEDCFAIDHALRLAIVADGMGGEACGEVASSLTVEELTNWFSSAQVDDSRRLRLAEAVEKAHRRVQLESRSGHACGGMGSTVVAAAWDLPELEIVSVGDSRVYLIRQGQLTQLTNDQNLGNQMRDSMGWTDEQVAKFPQRHILTSAVGAGDSVRIQQHSLELVPGDRLLLCTDGLHGLVRESELLRLAGSQPVEEAVQSLIRAANTAGGGDNITVVVLEWSAEEEN